MPWLAANVQYWRTQHKEAAEILLRYRAIWESLDPCGYVVELR